MPTSLSDNGSKMLNLSRLLTFAIILFAIWSAGAQGASAPQQSNPAGYQTSTITVNARIVVLDVVVLDKKGNLVWRNDLKPENFKIYEDGPLQTIRSFEAPSQHQMPPSDTAIG